MTTELARAADPIRTDWPQAPENLIFMLERALAGSRAVDSNELSWRAIAGHQQQAPPSCCDPSKRWAKLFFDSTVHLARSRTRDRVI